MRKLRIAVVVGTFPSVSETFILNQITDLVDRGHDVTIFSFRKGNTEIVHKSVSDYNLLDKTVFNPQAPTSKTARVAGAVSFIVKNISQLGLRKLFGIINPFRNTREVLNLKICYLAKWFFTREAFDIVHVHFAGNAIDIAMLKERGLLGKAKLVTSFHGFDIIPSRITEYNVIYDRVFKQTDIFTGNSQYTLDLLSKTVIDKKKVFLLPEALRTNQFSRKKDNVEAQNDKNTVNILFCGRLVEFKAPDVAVEIMRVLVCERKITNIKLFIIGSGDLQKKLEELITRYGLYDHIFLLGGRTQEEVVEALSKADIFLLPGVHEALTDRAENQGLVIQEAQAMELPVVVSDAGGMKYGLIDGETGFVVKQKDIQGFANKLELLIQNKQLRIKMGAAGSNFVKQYFDTVVVGNTLEQLYYSVLNEV
jgi:Glycosyltransferase